MAAAGGLVDDTWLSDALGRPAFHLGAEADPAAALAALGPGPAFVDARCDVASTGRAAALTAAGFCLADTNVQLLRPAGPAPAVEPAGARFAVAADEAPVRAIAAEAFVFDRFHADPAIGHDPASRLKAEWAGNFFAGRRGRWMVVADAAGGGVGGFLQLLEGKDGELVIDLVATGEAARRQGLAAAMIAFAAARCLPGQAVRVGTQIANIPSLRLYARLGFVPVSASYIFHYHRTPA